MRILCVIDSLGSGGAQRQLVNLGILFKKKGHDVNFLVYHSSDFYAGTLESYGIKVVTVTESSYFRRLFKMARVIRRGSYDSVLSFLEAPNLICELAAVFPRKWRLVVGERSANPAILSSFKRKIFRFFHFFADAIVANSNENINMVKKVAPFLPRKKMHVIYNAVDLSVWEPNHQSYSVRDGGRLTVTVTARHNYLKNLDGLVEALRLLPLPERDKLLVKWYGRFDDGDDSLDSAKRKIARYGLECNFEFLLPIENIYEEVNKADVVGLFSFYEGLPNSVCEGMVNSKVVISSDVSDVKSLVGDSFVFNPKEPSELARILSETLALSDEELESIGKANRRRALKLFDPDRVASEYLELLA